MFCQAIVNDIIAERIRKIEAFKTWHFRSSPVKVACSGLALFSVLQEIRALKQIDVFPRSASWSDGDFEILGSYAFRNVPATHLS